MPRPYEQRVMPRLRGPAPSIQGVQLDQSIARGLGAVGQTGRYLGYQMERERAAVRDRESATWTAKKLAQARSHWTQELASRQNNAAPGAPDFTPGFLDDFDKWSVEYGADAPNGEAAEELQLRLEGVKASLTDNALRFEAGARRAKASTDWAEVTNSLANTVMSDPRQYDAARGDALDLLESMDAPAADKAQWRLDLESTMAETALRSRMQKDPLGVLQSLRTGDDDKVNRLDVARRSILANAAETEIRQRNAEAMAGETLRLKRVEAAMDEAEMSITAKVLSGTASQRDILSMLEGRQIKASTGRALVGFLDEVQTGPAREAAEASLTARMMKGEAGQEELIAGLEGGAVTAATARAMQGYLDRESEGRDDWPMALSLRMDIEAGSPTFLRDLASARGDERLSNATTYRLYEEFSDHRKSGGITARADVKAALGELEAGLTVRDPFGLVNQDDAQKVMLAQDMFRRRLQEDPGRDPYELRDDVLKTFRGRDTPGLSSLPDTRFLVGTKVEPDADASIAAIQEALASGAITEAEAANEAEALEVILRSAAETQSRSAARSQGTSP